MAHMLKNNKNMAYTGEVPWHGLGTQLPDLFTAADAIKHAGLDYNVECRPIFIKGSADSNLIKIDGRFATVRTDTEIPLGVVGSRYTPLQNIDAFKFFDAITGEGEAIYETAGVLGEGDRIWLLAKLPGYISLRGGDDIKKFLLLTNSHDGSSMVRCMFTTVRVVCNNTLMAALGGAQKNESVAIRHTANVAQTLEEAHKLMGITNKLYDQLGVIFGLMSKKNVVKDEVDAFYKQLVPDNEQAESNERTKNIRKEMLSSFEGGVGSTLVSANGTVWGLLNSVTDYVDHARSSKKDDNKRLESIWFGSGGQLKKRAFELSASMV